MTDRWLVRCARTAALVGLLLALAGTAVYFSVGLGGTYWANYGAFGTMLAVGLGALVWFVIPGQPRNAVLGILSVSSLLSGLWVLGFSAAAVQIRDRPDLLNPFADQLALVPADLPTSAAWMIQFAGPASTAGFILAFTFGLLLFPDGRLPTPRWRSFGWFTAVAVALTAVGSAWSYRPTNTGFVDQGVVIELGITMALVSAAGALYGIYVRFRRGSEATKRQLKWIVWGASAIVPAVVLATFAAEGDYVEWVRAPFMLAAAVFFGSIGIAVGRHDLFDIDVVISRTVVVGGLVAFITLVYAVLVGAVGVILGSGTESALPLSVAATVVVAIAFQPLRERMHRWANRLVYGERATPYEVLSRFSSRMSDAAVTQELIPQMARLLTEGTGAGQATVWIRTDDRLAPVATWPPESPIGEASLQAADHLAPVEHDGEPLGALTVRMPGAEELTTIERQLVDDLASQAGLVLRNERLIQELRASRQRLVAAQDEERRRLERNLHDGAQQQLVALKLKLSLAQRIDDPEKRHELLAGLMTDTDDAIDSLRDLARGIYPPTLAEHGLVSALEAQAAKAAVPTRVAGDGVQRYAPDLEAAVYFVVLEALQNVAKYAEASEVSIALRGTDGLLRVEVSDDGRGFDSATTARGSGLQNMEDRIEALGGSIAVASSPGSGTTISGVVPVVVQSL